MQGTSYYDLYIVNIVNIVRLEFINLILFSSIWRCLLRSHVKKKVKKTIDCILTVIRNRIKNLSLRT